MIPSDLSDFNVYGGLYRYLNLAYVPEVSIDRVQIDAVLDKNLKKATLAVQAFSIIRRISGKQLRISSSNLLQAR